jgi:2-polyprenyl-3-methyl-5-hydroxy-6-metoxy-1,4-benzoquinol methylase
MTPDDSPALSPLEYIFELDTWDIRAAAFRAAVELGVFGVLADGPQGADEVARRIGADPEATRILLDAVGSFGLLTSRQNGYALAPGAAGVLDQAGRGSIVEAYRREFAARDRFTESIRTGRAARDIRAEDAAGLWAAYASAEIPKRDALVELARSRWQALGVTGSTMHGARILDVGCGSGLKSLALAVDDPAVSVVAIDSAAVLEVAAQAATLLGVSSRVMLVEGDVTALERLDGPFDIALFGFVLHYFDPDEVVAILAQARRLLAVGGRVVIATPLATPGDLSDAAPALTAVWMVNVSAHGRLYGLGDYSGFLAATGFGPPITAEGTPWLAAIAT